MVRMAGCAPLPPPSSLLLASIQPEFFWTHSSPSCGGGDKNTALVLQELSTLRGQNGQVTTEQRDGNSCAGSISGGGGEELPMEVGQALKD